jgi:metal-responsive CopG/Arc/MetJ family transcriptional regulator
MAREDWISVNVDRNLCKQIDRVIKHARKENGVKYDSRPDFVEEAITEKLKRLEVIA